MRTWFTVSTLALALVFGMPVHVESQATPQAPRVLILNSYEKNSAPYNRAATAFRTDFQAQYAEAVTFWEYDLQSRPLEQPTSNRLKAQLLRERYAADPPDLVVSIGPPAIQFWLHWREDVLAGVPMLAMGGQPSVKDLPFSRGDGVVMGEYSYRQLVQNIVELFPETDTVLMVFGASDHERALARDAAERLQQSKFSALDFRFTQGLGLHEIRNLASQLPPHSAILHVFFESDGDGHVLPAEEGLRLIRLAANAPVFGTFEDQVGYGIIGGRLTRATGVGRQMAATAKRLLDQPGRPVAWDLVEKSPPTYDLRELQSWGVDLQALPEDSVLLFQPPSLWRRYAAWTIAGTLFVLLQSAWIVALLWQRSRIQRFQAVRETLAQRLVSAQEGERRRIALELHDDLSQRLARLSIDAAAGASSTDAPDARETLGALRPELERINQDIHDLSYRLHPAMIYDLGLVAALQAELARIRRTTPVAIRESYPEAPLLLPDDDALCLYRVGVEAVHNAVRHAEAGEIGVTLTASARAVGLTVMDDGVGFDPETVRGSGTLGLFGMSERVNLAGGKLTVHSRPGHGTCVSATLPRRQDPAYSR